MVVVSHVCEGVGYLGLVAPEEFGEVVPEVGSEQKQVDAPPPLVW